MPMLVAIVNVAIIAGGCGAGDSAPGASDRADTTLTSATGTGTDAMHESAGEMDHGVDADASDRPSFCNAVGNGTPVSGHGNGSHVSEIYVGKTKGPLSDGDCVALTSQLDELITATEDLSTKADAEAAGWHELAEYISGLGTHHSKSFVLPTPGAPDSGRAFDPASPTFLIYGGEQDDAPLVGAAFHFVGKGDPPEAFAGTNDWWHEHNTTCIGPGGKILAGAEEIPDADCAALGGANIKLTGGPGAIFGDNGNWLLHVWLAPYEYRPDIFASGHPCLLESGIAPFADPCWEIARRDPALGPPAVDGAHTGHED
jgi:hypothetical protein